jgi:hypothetical protein
MMNEAMHQTMINQLGVFTNTIQNCLTKTLKKGKEEGYVGPAYFQPDQPPPVFSKTSAASQPIIGSNMEVS